MKFVIKLFKKAAAWLFGPTTACHVVVVKSKVAKSESLYAGIEKIVALYFPEFIPYATKHYNLQLKMLGQVNSYPAKYVYDDMLSLAADYFMRNRSRLFQWWCMNNENVLRSNEEFNVQRDLIGFNGAFKLMCKNMFDIDIEPDASYEYGINVINDDGSVNYAFAYALKVAVIKSSSYH